MNDDDERRLGTSGGIEDFEANTGRAIHLLTAERVRLGEVVEQKAADVLDRREWLSICIARRPCVERLCERGELSRTDDLGPAAWRPSAIVEPELKHDGRVGDWRLDFSSRRSITGQPPSPNAAQVQHGCRQPPESSKPAFPSAVPDVRWSERGARPDRPDIVCGTPAA